MFLWWHSKKNLPKKQEGQNDNSNEGLFIRPLWLLLVCNNTNSLWSFFNMRKSVITLDTNVFIGQRNLLSLTFTPCVILLDKSNQVWLIWKWLDTERGFLMNINNWPWYDFYLIPPLMGQCELSNMPLSSEYTWDILLSVCASLWQICDYQDYTAPALWPRTHITLRCIKKNEKKPGYTHAHNLYLPIRLTTV